jgi:hypothetical protein
MVRVIQVYWVTMLFQTRGLRSCILKIHVRLGVSRAYISYGYENWVCTPTEIQSHDQNFILPAQEFWPSAQEIRSKSSPGCGGRSPIRSLCNHTRSCRGIRVSRFCALGCGWQWVGVRKTTNSFGRLSFWSCDLNFRPERKPNSAFHTSRIVRFCVLIRSSR